MEYLISVIITSYNQKDYLKQAIDSVLNQTIKPYEILILDDRSSDTSQNLIKEYKNNYPELIKSYTHHENLGISRNRNFGLTMAKGNFVTFLDGDDRILPEKLEFEIATLKKNPDAGIVFSNYIFINAEGSYIDKWIEDSSKVPSGYIFKEIFARTFPKSRLFRNELVKINCFKKSGFYDQSLYMYEDWDMKIRLSKYNNIAFCNKILSEYRIHTRGISSKLNQNNIDDIEKIYEKNKELTISLSSNDYNYIERNLGCWKEKLLRFIALNEIKTGNKKKGIYIWISSIKKIKSFFPVDLIIILYLIIPGFFLNAIRIIHKFAIATKSKLMSTYE